MVVAQNKQASRKFIDLIKTATAKWANWDPSVPIEPGDYGQVDKESGAFIREGNVYSEPEVADIASRYPIVYGPQIDSYTIQSLNVDKLGGSPTTETVKVEEKIPPPHGQWQFNNTRGALCLVYGSQIVRLSEEMQEELKNTVWGHGKYLVTHIHRCNAYAFYLSDKTGETVSIGLNTDVSSTSPPEGASGNTQGPTWAASGTTGFFRQGAATEPIFTPLYGIKEIKKRAGRRRQSPDPMDDEKEDWVQYEVPWNYLDEDGGELPEYSDEETDSDVE